MEPSTRTSLGAPWPTIRAGNRRLSKKIFGRVGMITAVTATLIGTPTVTAQPSPPNRPAADRDALWKIVHDRCQLGYQRTGTYAPCTLVDEDSGTALYKVDYDPYQYLLLPLARITGIEDPALQDQKSRNFLSDAWSARFLVTSRLDNSLPESDVTLTINPKNARTQDQLHIHISCAKPTTSAILKKVDTSQYVQWRELPDDIEGHSYHALAVNSDALESRNLFQDVHTKVIADGKKMEHASVALANIAPDRFLLLVGEGTEDQPASAETLQDHNCSIAKE